MPDISEILADALSGTAQEGLSEALKKGVSYLFRRGRENYRGYYLLGLWTGDLVAPTNRAFRQEATLSAWLDGKFHVSAIFAYRTYINGAEAARGADRLFRIDADTPITEKFTLTFERFLHTELMPIPRVITDSANYDFNVEIDPTTTSQLDISTRLKSPNRLRIKGQLIRQE